MFTIARDELGQYQDPGIPSQGPRRVAETHVLGLSPRECV